MNGNAAYGGVASGNLRAERRVSYELIEHLMRGRLTNAIDEKR